MAVGERDNAYLFFCLLPDFLPPTHPPIHPQDISVLAVNVTRTTKLDRKKLEKLVPAPWLEVRLYGMEGCMLSCAMHIYTHPPSSFFLPAPPTHIQNPQTMDKMQASIAAFHDGGAFPDDSDRPAFTIDSKVEGYCGMCNVPG